MGPVSPQVDVSGVSGSRATLAYRWSFPGVAQPWTYDTTTTQPAVAVNVSAQGNGDSIGCRITVDDKIQDERTSDGANAQTFCLMKSG